MTITFGKGEEFWIELLEIQVTTQDAAGAYNSAVVNLTRPGAYLGAAFVGKGEGTGTTSVQAFGQISLRDQGSGGINIGEVITGVVLRVNKQVSTDGEITPTFTVCVFLRKNG